MSIRHMLTSGLLAGLGVIGVCSADPVIRESFESPDMPLNQREGGVGFRTPWRSNAVLQNGWMVLTHKTNLAKRAFSAQLDLSVPLYVGVVVESTADLPDQRYATPVVLRDAEGVAVAGFGLSNHQFLITVGDKEADGGIVHKRFGRYTDGDRVQLVLRLEQSGTQVLASLWVNPTGPESGGQSAFAISAVPTGRLIEQLEIRQWGGEDQQVRFREIRISTDWVDVLGEQRVP